MKPVWLTSYEPGVPRTINPDAFSSINSMFAWIYNKYRDLPALGSMDQVFTYQQLDQQSKSFAAFLHNKLGFRKGERFAIMMPNIVQYPVAMLGILRAGGIVVNVNFLCTPEEFEYQMRDTQAVGLIVLENFAHVASWVMANTQLKHIIIAKISDIFEQPKASIVDFQLKYIKQKIPRWHFDSYYRYNDVLDYGNNSSFKDIEVSNTDIAFIQYTGGTTGSPKGALLTHRNIIADVMQVSTFCTGYVNPGKEIVIAMLPLFHIGSMMNFFIFAYNGALNILITNPFDTTEFVKNVKKYKFSVISGVNGLYNILLQDPKFTTLDFSNLKIAICGGMELQQSVAMRWKYITKTNLIEAYGMTEAALGVCCSPLNSNEYNGTVGVPLPSTEISVRNNRGDEIGIDQPGEIWIRGPQVMNGYWQHPKESQEIITSDGWLKTGDIGIINEHGYLKLIDRKKDVIKISSFVVFPSEVEKVIASIPQVKEVAVVDAFDESCGEMVKAFVVCNDPQLTEKQIIRFCEKHLTYYKVPKVVEFRDELPKSSMGKILRRSLRYEGGPLRFI